MTTTKLNYSKIRNGQKKNRSVNEERDFISNDLDNYDDNNNNDLDEIEKSNRGNENKNEELLKVFGDNINTGNLDYVNALLKNKATNTNETTKDKTNLKKKKGHVRHKSNITGSNTKNQIKMTNKDPMDQIPMDVSHTPSMRRDLSPEMAEIDNKKNLSVDDNLFKPKNGGRSATHATVSVVNYGISSNLVSKSSNNDNTPTLVGSEDMQERLFDQYFKKNKNNKNSLMKRSMSLEDFRKDNEVFGNSNQSTSVFAPSEAMTQQSRDTLPSKKLSNEIMQQKFMSKIDQFIDYFTKSENSNSQRNIKSQDFLINNNLNQKAYKNYQRELLSLQNENKILKLNLEQMEVKINELLLVNKKYSYELKEYKLKDEENKKKIRLLEQKVLKQAQKKEEYKYKLIHTQELLTKEKIDNENNLLALKKVLSSKINTTLDNKVGLYKQKNVRDQDQLLNAIYMTKKDKDDVNKSKFKDKRIPENIMIDSRYDSNFFKKIKDSALQYDISSLLSPKLGTPSDDEENTPDSMHSPSDLEGSYEQDNFKGLNKEQEIKYLKDRLKELIQKPDHSINNLILQEGKNSTRNKSKGKLKNIDYSLKNADIREKQTSLSKLHQNANIDARYKYLKEGRIESSIANDNNDKSFSLHNSD